MIPGRGRFFSNKTASPCSTVASKAVKLDECDYQPDSAIPWSFPPNSAFPSGLDGEQTHSLFGLLYQQVMLTAVSGERPAAPLGSRAQLPRAGQFPALRLDKRFL